MWWPEVFGRVLMWIAYFFHDVAALVMLGGFSIHLYEGTAAMPGTFRSMVRGTVSERWAWTHHPAWYRDPGATRARITSERDGVRLSAVAGSRRGSVSKRPANVGLGRQSRLRVDQSYRSRAAKKKTFDSSDRMA